MSSRVDAADATDSGDFRKVAANESRTEDQGDASSVILVTLMFVNASNEISRVNA